jgi:hypothetical protein
MYKLSKDSFESMSTDFQKASVIKCTAALNSQGIWSLNTDNLIVDLETQRKTLEIHPAIHHED